MTLPTDSKPEPLRHTHAPTPKPIKTRFSRKALNIIIVITALLIVLFSNIPAG